MTTQQQEDPIVSRSDAEQALLTRAQDAVSGNPQWAEIGRRARETIDAIEAHVQKNKCTYYQAGEALGLDTHLLWQLGIRDQVENLCRDMNGDAVKRNRHKGGQ